MFYNGEFSSEEDICRQFAISEIGGRVLYADYEVDCYDGSAHVIFTDENGGLFLVQGGHCSCYGLEDDQWNPEPITIAMMTHMVENASWGFWVGMKSFVKALGQIEQEVSPKTASDWLDALRNQ